MNGPSIGRINGPYSATSPEPVAFAQPPARGRSRQQLISTDETIDYSTLEVRQLGDIYEGLLGGQLRRKEDGHLELVNERGENQRHGIFYTPDWVVRYLVRETLSPLLDEIDETAEVRSAMSAKSREKRCNNSFAYGVLRLNIVDPAMGSAHFLVRATEFLAERIFQHPTTRRMTEQVLGGGKSARTREQILADGRIPVPPGCSQEQAEIAYWRRRVVEACIYGVDTNPLAVELAKLALWLTCIAVDEPLNFLDHHLRCGNSLLGAAPEELRRLPFLSDDEAKEGTFEIGGRLTETMAAVIKETVDIESQASTEMEVVKAKELTWRRAHAKLSPFLEIADWWVAALDGLPIDHISYRNLALTAIDPFAATTAQTEAAKGVKGWLGDELSTKKAALQPFHWRLEFPDVFYQADGQARPPDLCGFDAVLGNPPYVSTHTSAAQAWRAGACHGE